MPEITVNGETLEVPAGANLLQECLDAGIDVPHYCYHPGLAPDGNCRMCLVETSTSRKLEVACMTRCSEGMEVNTQNEKVREGRKYVLEYMLINHPLDCPICDKAGECDLQDFTFQHRRGTTRFAEKKVIKHTKDLGPDIKIWGNRCIACTRCVRFCDDIAGTGELTLVNRGDHSVIDVHPEIPIDNPMALNVVDICPVGALIDKNFLYQSRVWFAERIDTICGSCSRGCNVTATVRENEIKRLQPRYNGDVNDWWMCDAGRLNTAYVSSEDRLRVGRGTLGELAEGLKDRAPQSTAILVSTWQTVEELHLVKGLAEALGAHVGFLTHTEGERWVAKNGFSIETDKTPNRAGAEHVFGPLDQADQTAAIQAGVADGSIGAVLVINGIPGQGYPEWLTAAAETLDLFAAADFTHQAAHEHASVLIATATHFEKSGTWVNQDGRLQRIRPVIKPRRTTHADVTWLQALMVALGHRERALSTEGVFKQVFDGLRYKAVTDQGIPLPQTTGVAK